MILWLIVKPILLVKIARYTPSDICGVFRPCLLVTLVSLPVPLYIAGTLDCMELKNFVLCIVASCVIIAVAVYTVGMDGHERRKVRSYAMKKIGRRA